MVLNGSYSADPDFTNRNAQMSKGRMRRAKGIHSGPSLAAVAISIIICLFAAQLALTAHWTSAISIIPVLILSSLIVLATGLLGNDAGDFDLRQPWLLLLVFHIPFWILGSWRFALSDSPSSTLLSGAHEQIARALLLISLCFSLIAIGYRFSLSYLKFTPRRTKSVPWDVSKVLLIGIALYLLCWMLRLHAYCTVLTRPWFYPGQSPSTLFRMANTTLPAFLLTLFWIVAYQNPGRRKLYSACVLLTCCEVAWGLAYGVMKSLIFLPVILPVLPFIVMHKRLPWSRIFIGGVLLIGIAYPYVDAVRAHYFQFDGPRRPEAIGNALEDLFHSPQAYDRSGLLVNSQRALDRSSGLSSLCQALQMHSDGSLDLRGEFYRRAIIGLIPRFLWKNKPIIHEGSYFSAYIDGQRGISTVDLTRVTSSVAPTLFGSFFWNLGWWGAGFSSLFLGMFSGIAYRWLIAGCLSSPRTLLYYIAILNALDTTETEVAKLPGSLIWGVFLAWAANRLFAQTWPRFKGRTRSKTAAHSHHNSGTIGTSS